MTSTSTARARRASTAFAVTAAGALALTACGGGDSTPSTGGSGGSAAPAESFTFSYPISNSADVYKALTEKYTAATGKKVVAKSMPGDNYQQAMRTQLQGGSASDLIYTQPGSGQDTAVLTLVKAGMLAPLGGKSASVIPAGAEPLVQVDGKTYGQPTDLIPVGLIANAKALKDSGITYPTNQTELLAACSALAAKGKSFMAVAGTAAPNVGLIAQSVAATRVYANTPDWDAQRTAGKVTFADTQGWKDTLQTLIDWKNGGCFQKGFQGGGFDAITQGMGSGSSLTAEAPGSAAAEIMTAVPGAEISVVPVPPADGGKPFMLASANYSLSINAKASAGAQAAAQAFLDWLAEPANSAAFAKESGGVAIGGDLSTLLPQYEPVKSLLESKSYVPLPNATWPNAKVYDALSKGVQGLMSDQGDIDTVLKAMDAAWAG